MAMTIEKKRRWPWIAGGVVALLAVAAFVALSRLDAYLLTRARTEAQALSQRLGRPVEVGDLSTQLFPHVGVEVAGLKVGPAEGEEASLAELEELDVAVALWPALRSRGQEIQVLNAEATGLLVQVLRKKDGTTNLDQVLKRLEETSPPEAPEPEGAPPSDLSAVRVDRAALTDARIVFRDLSGAKAEELAINDLDVEVRDLRAGKPLELVLKAAVLATAQNLEMRLATAPLPKTLVPTPVQVALKVQPIDLAPLGPFMPASVGLQAGRVQADWKAELGAAVPGGTGDTSLTGTLLAQGLRFAGAEGGEPLDVALDTDVRGDAEKGDLSINRLKFDVGPAGITGKGSVKGLRSPTPSVQGLEIVGHDLDPARLARYHPGLARALKGQVEGPIGLVVRGSGTEAAQSVSAELDFTPVRLRIPDSLSKEAGAPMRLVTHLRGAAATGGPLRFENQTELAGVDLRPGGTVNKAPGQRLDVSAQGTYQPPEEGKRPVTRVELSALTVHLLEDTLTGKVGYEQAGTGPRATTSFQVALKGPRLDADALLLESAEAESPPAAEPPADPNRFRGYRGEMDVELGALRFKKADYTNVRMAMKMVDDTLTLEKFSAGVYGGQVAADGTQVRLGPARMPFDAKLQVRGVDLGSAFASFTDKKILGGQFNGQIALKGAGTQLDDLSETLAGVIQGDILKGTFFGKDLISGVTAPLAKALPFASKALPDGKTTSLGEQLPFGLTIANGAAQLKNPITFTRPEAALNLGGGVKLNGELAMQGTVALAPAVIQRLTLGKARVAEAVPVGLQLTGPAWSPHITGLDVKPAVATIVKGAAAGLAGQLLGEKGKAVQETIAGGKEAAQAKQRELEARAAEERSKAEERARQEAANARKRAEDEAKKKLRGVFGR